MFEQFFELKKNKTNVKVEILAGFTTFMTMAYILAINPSTLTAFNKELNLQPQSPEYMNPNGVFMATALAAALGCFLMAFLANYPFALAPGMGLNAYFAYTVVLHYGYSWRVALAAVFVEGVLFIIMSLTKVRETIFYAIPATIKYAVSCGIGIFIAFIGLQGAGLCVSDPNTLVALCDFSKENFSTQGIGAVLAIVGVLTIGILLIKKVKGAILIGILITWVLGIICEVAGIYQVVPEKGYMSLLPDFSQGLQIGSLFDVAFQLEFPDVTVQGILNFFVVIFAFLFVDLFDTLGTLIGVSSKAKMLDENGKLPHIRGALLADAIATTGGALLGTSTTTTYVESATGVTEGGRTGLTSFTTGVLFLVSIFLSPVFLAIPAFATAPALIVVGFYMMGAVVEIDFENPSEAIPAFLCIIAMPLFYSISDGIFIGVISYVLLNLCTGKAKEKRIGGLMYVLAILFVLKYIFI